MLKATLRKSILFLLISSLCISAVGQTHADIQTVSHSAVVDSVRTAYSPHKSKPFDHLIDFGLILYSIPVGIWEAVTVSEIFLPVSPYLALASALATGVGYPVWVGRGLRQMTSLHWKTPTRAIVPGSYPAFYISGSLQYAKFQTSQAEANLNSGFAIEYWYPLTKRIGVRTGFHLTKRIVTVNNKTFYDPSHMEDELLLVNLKYVSWETYGPVELIFMWPQSTDVTVFASFGFSLVLPSYGGDRGEVGTVPISEKVDYTTEDSGTEDLSVNRLYTASIGLVKTHWINEIQYTLDGAGNPHLVHQVNITDPAMTIRFRLSYRLPL